MRILAVIISLGLTFTFANGQDMEVSGYLGKRNYGMLKIRTGVRQDPEKSLSYQDEYTENLPILGFFALKSETEFVYGRVVSNRFISEAKFGFNRTSFIIDTDYYYNKFRDQKGNDLGYFAGLKGRPKVTDKYFGYQAKFFKRKKGGLAPIGGYFGLYSNIHNYTVNMATVRPTTRSTTSFDQPRVVRDIDFGKIKYRAVDLGMTFGISRAVRDDLLLDFGTSLALFIPISGWYDDKIYDITIGDDVSYSLKRSMSYYQLATIHIGLGYLF